MNNNLQSGRIFMSDSNNQIDRIDQALKVLKETYDFNIEPCNIKNIEDNPKYKKLEITAARKPQIYEMMDILPKILEVNELNRLSNKFAETNVYVMTLPKELSPYLMEYSDDRGYSNILKGNDSKFAYHIGSTQIDMSNTLRIITAYKIAFSAMSIATQQHYLSEINSKLDRIKLGIDKILEFLYGDKKAELMAEVSFVKYALNNYAAIMNKEDHTAAILSGLLQSKKTAMKDCDFYISDLEATLNLKNNIPDMVSKMVQIEGSLSLSLQLLVMSVLLEINYSQNYDKDLIKYIEDDISLYIDKTNKLIIGYFNRLKEKVDTANAGILKKVNKDELQASIDSVLNKFENGGESELTKTLRTGIHAAENTASYYITSTGDIYIRSS